VRFDDTNPETEADEYVQSILQSVRWMGYTPAAVTYCSDYFPQLYAFAEQLMARGSA
jgi:glutaminyl-tRNA synthetase